MPKRLVVCCDGTWNTPDQLIDGRPAPTNVTKVALRVAPKDLSGREQRTFYDRGVGTNRGERIRGGAFGFGLSRNVRDTYRFLVQAFEPGDELFFFGFSRGAFTARSTVGFVRNSGILRREHAGRIDEAYGLYRSRRSRTHPLSVEAQLFRRSYSYETRIRFIGVWDTVGALGIPLSGLRLVNLFNRRWRFHDTDLSTTVDAAFQALAIDEKRGPFRPAIWKQQAHAVGQRLEQVWFAGVHSDIGGGYSDPALAEIALRWMVDRASAYGLVFEADAFAPLPPGEDEALRHTGRYVIADALGQLHESQTGFYRVLPPFVRDLGVTDSPHEYVASSALERHRRMPEYMPPGLATYLDRTHQVIQV
ncbi:MAG: DUF2235 domain-containing protein [Actinomycetota bacterium]|nr:DUF2235 domain-containing protein [Actinomycetota bacterium]